MRVIPLRAVVIILTVILFVATVLGVILAACADVRFGLPTHDKTAVINTVVAVGSFALVAWGVVVALAAYVSATGSPDLSVEINFGAHTGPPAFRELRDDVVGVSNRVPGDRRVYIEPIETGAPGSVVIKNSSKYSALNPGVRISLHGLGGMPPQEGWTTVSAVEELGPYVLQWDGGTNYIIHGQWSRTLPPLDLRGMFSYKDDPAFIIAVAADGYDPKVTRFPIVFGRTYMDRRARSWT